MDGSLHIDFEMIYRQGPAVRAELRMSFEDPQIWVLFGRSGSGKTTILRALAGLERPQKGEIRAGPQIWLNSNAGVFVPPKDRNVGFLHQDYALFPHMTVDDNIAYGLHARGMKNCAARVGRLKSILQIDELGQRYPGQISGGQKQRVALARALAPQPCLLLLDEPLSALDGPARGQVRSELRSWLKQLGILTVVVTHDRAEAMTLGDKIIVQEEGEIRQVGSVDEVFRRPADLPTARCLGVENLVSVRVVSSSAGRTVVAVGDTQLVSTSPPPADERQIWAAIRAEAIRLASHETVEDQANLIDAQVTGVYPEGAVTRVTLGGEPSLVCSVLARSSLSRGQMVRAVIPAEEVHLVGRPVPVEPIKKPG